MSICASYLLPLRFKWTLSACSVKTEQDPPGRSPMPAGTGEGTLVGGAGETAGERGLLPDPKSSPGGPLQGHPAPAVPAAPQAALVSATAVQRLPAAKLGMWAISPASGSCGMAASPLPSSCRVQSLPDTQLLQWAASPAAPCCSAWLLQCTVASSSLGSLWAPLEQNTSGKTPPCEQLSLSSYREDIQQVPPEPYRGDFSGIREHTHAL